MDKSAPPEYQVPTVQLAHASPLARSVLAYAAPLAALWNERLKIER